MPYSIQVRFDSYSNSIIYSLASLIESLGVINPYMTYSAVPHIAVANSSDLSIDQTIEDIQKIDIPTQELDFSFIGTFPGTENVIFLAPKPTKDLIHLHQYINSKLLHVNSFNLHYTEQHWIPHCTVGIEIPEILYPEAMKLVKQNFKPFKATITSIALTSFRPNITISSKNLCV